MRRSGQLRSSIAGKARQTGDSFNQVTLCPPSTNEEAKGALKGALASKTGLDDGIKIDIDLAGA